MPIAGQILLVVLVLIAAVYDIRWRRIPNWLVGTGLLLGIALNAFLFEWGGLKMSLLGIGLAMLIYFPLYLLRGMGAGDVKLMMAVGSIAGPGVWFLIFIVTAILGGIIAVVLLLAKGRLRKTLWNVGFMFGQLFRLQAPYAGNEELDIRSGKGMRLPHGVVIAIGTMAFLVIARLFLET